MKKVYLVIAVIALITCLTGIPYLVEGIAARGWDGVNYGRIIVPLLISGISFLRFKKKYAAKGYKYVGYMPTDITPHGKIVEMDLIFEIDQ